MTGLADESPNTTVIIPEVTGEIIEPVLSADENILENILIDETMGSPRSRLSTLIDLMESAEGRCENLFQQLQPPDQNRENLTVRTSVQLKSRQGETR